MIARRLPVLLCSLLVGACAATRPPLPPQASWEERMPQLQHAASWGLEGRAAAAVGGQGWQATLSWRQSGADSEARLAGPFGIGANVLRLGPSGLSINGAQPSAAALADLQSRLGFDLPLSELRYWLLGVPDPASSFEVERNAQDRAAQLRQDEWTIDIDRYVPAGGDSLPGHLVLNREGVRVRIAVDHWDPVR